MLQQAEQALAEGQLGALQQQLQAIDVLVGPNRATVWPDALRGRLAALRAEGARLKGWQQWGGARAREDLVTEAEALARHTQAATDSEAVSKPKLNLTDHAQAIQALRQRWKELDRLSAAAPQTLWQRFDAALQTAHAPVAAQQAALQAAREENLAAREALLAGLDALPLVSGAHRQRDGNPLPSDVGRNGKTWCANCMASSLCGAARAGRHTVPAGARQALQQAGATAWTASSIRCRPCARRPPGSVSVVAEAQALVTRAGRPCLVRSRATVARHGGLAAPCPPVAIPRAGVRPGARFKADTVCAAQPPPHATQSCRRIW
jgi:hypothetical protein